jgi:hypothetical protein
MSFYPPKDLTGRSRFNNFLKLMTAEAERNLQKEMDRQEQMLNLQSEEKIF